jgi:membrane fusion protein, multidrug efflux system
LAHEEGLRMTETPEEKKDSLKVAPAEPTTMGEQKPMAEKPVEIKPEDAKTEKASPHQNARKKRLWQFTGCLIVIAFAFLLYWFFYLQYHEWTDDAYANGNMININSAISGSVVAFYADDTDFVTEGQLLVELDRTDYQIAYEKEIATLGSVVLQVRQLYDSVPVNQESVEYARVALSRAAFDYENRLHLIDSGAVSNEDFIHSKDALLQAQISLRQAEDQLQVSIDAAGNTPIEKHPLIEQQKTNVVTAYYNLYHCSIFAPATGYIAQRTVDVGQWLTPYTNLNLMAIIPTDYVWVDANFKETQLTYMRIGQPATVTYDMYGSDVVYKGKVLGIASGSGSVFSLIPPQNATGNWIKIVQRLAVRISLDPETLIKFPSRLGISAEVDVDITNQELPRLAEVPPTKPVGSTNVFDIDLEEVNEIMAKVISENLKNKELQ